MYLEWPWKGRERRGWAAGRLAGWEGGPTIGEFYGRTGNNCTAPINRLGWLMCCSISADLTGASISLLDESCRLRIVACLPVYRISKKHFVQLYNTSIQCVGVFLADSNIPNWTNHFPTPYAPSVLGLRSYTRRHFQFNLTQSKYNLRRRCYSTGGSYRMSIASCIVTKWCNIVQWSVKKSNRNVGRHFDPRNPPVSPKSVSN